MSDNSKERKVSQGNRDQRVITIPELMVDVRADLLYVGIKAGLNTGSHAGNNVRFFVGPRDVMK